MTEEQTTDDAWREVCRQFQVLGERLAEAFRTAWESEENRQRLQDMRTGLEAMIDEVARAVKETSASPEAQQVGREAEKAVESARAAGEQAMQDLRPHLLSTLRQVNAELQKMIHHLEQQETASEVPAADLAPGEPGVAQTMD